MTARRFLSLLALFALLAMPFGHMQASAHGSSARMASPCHGGAPARGTTQGAAIDCSIACAAIAPCARAHVPPALAVPVIGQVRLPAFHGILRAAEPPPPRLA